MMLVGTKTWLSHDVSNNEVISAEWNYNIYQKDRPYGYSRVMLFLNKLICTR